MDVTCERCSTEYEFDDTLVSERGTTVKCTNCGHQFKVRRTDGMLPEKWVVRTVDGRELEFTMLRELQSAITRAAIDRDDVLSRGGSRPRRLGSIAELDPFFRGLGGGLAPGMVQGIGGPAAPSRPRSPTPQGLGGPLPSGFPANEADTGSDALSESETVMMIGRPSAVGVAAVPFSRSPSAPPPAPISSEPVTSPAGRVPIVPPTPPVPSIERAPRSAWPGVIVAPGEAPPLPDGYAARGDGAAPQPAPAADVGSARSRPWAAAEQGLEISTLPAGIESPIPPPIEPALPVVEILSAPPSPTIKEMDEGEAPARREAVQARSPAERIVRRSISTMPPSALTPTPMDVRSSMMSDDAYGDPRFSSFETSRRTGVAGWMIGLVVAGLALLAVLTLGPRYLKPNVSTPARTGDERVAALLGEGERSLLDGDLETARDKFIMASGLAEEDPRVAADLARLETINADVRWLRVKLLAEGDPERGGAKHELDASIGRARAAVDQAQKVAPTDVAVTRARVDLLRLQGDVDGARKLVGTIAAGSSQPENALTLAALDLAEAKPSWPVAIERLRAAVSGEQNLGRARAFLIYSMARSGDLAGARAEHERLAALGRPHPLTAALLIFIERQEGGQPAGSKPAGAGPAQSAAVEATAGPVPGSPRPGRRSGEEPGSERVSDDYVVPNREPDTSDLPGAATSAPMATAAPPATAAPTATPTGTPTAAHSATPAPTSATPPPIDTSDLPGFKHE